MRMNFMRFSVLLIDSALSCAALSCVIGVPLQSEEPVYATENNSSSEFQDSGEAEHSHTRFCTIECAREAYRNEQYGVALPILNRHVERHPTDVRARVLRAYCNVELLRPEAADRELSELFRRGDVPKELEAWAETALGRAARAGGQWEKSLEVFQGIQEAHPDYRPLETSWGIGTALCALGKHRRAREYFQFVLIHDDRLLFPDAFSGAAVNEISLGNLVKARDILIRGSKRFSDDPWIWSYLADVHRYLGDNEREQQALKEAYSLVYTEAPTAVHKVVLSLPFDGRWLVSDGNNSKALDSGHRMIDSRFSWDFVKIHDGPGSERNDSFGQPVTAAASGDVVAVVDGVNDTRPDDPSWTLGRSAAGNRVVIDHGNGEYSHYYHLKKGSIAVEIGDRVRRSQLLGRCGSSGTKDAHLHFSLMDGVGGKAISQPAEFSDFVRATSPRGETELVTIGVPKEGDFVENRTRGDLREDKDR